MAVKLTDEECAQDAFCNMEGFAYAGWSVLVLCYIVGLAGIMYLWMRRPQRKTTIGKRLPSLSESLIENDHSPQVSLKKRSDSTNSSNSSNSKGYSKLSKENNDNVDDDNTGE